MRILICSTEAPLPPLNGHRLQVWHLARELSTRHDVTVLAYRWPDQPADGAPPGIDVRLVDKHLDGRARRTSLWIGGVLTGTPLAVRELVPGIRPALDTLLAETSFDIVHVTSSAFAPLRSSLGDLPKVLVAIDAWHVNARASVRSAPAALKPAYQLQARQIEHYLRDGLRGYGRVIAVSERDTDALRSLDPGLPVTAIPNGVDARHFTPGRPEEVEDGLIVFLGAMSWPANIDAARFLAADVLPLLRTRHPAARLALVGRSAGPEIRALDALPHVDVVGEVPDVRPWLRRAQAFACPMVSGTGIKNKLLEALACAAPTVATTLACQGTGIVPEHELLVADTAEDLAGALGRVLGDPALRERLGAAGRRYVVASHAWEAVGRAYEEVYVDVCRESRAVGAPGRG